MISGAIHALRSALNPCRDLETPSAHLTQAMSNLQQRLQDCSPGSAELTKAIERVEAAFTKNDGWKFVKHCFERDVDRATFVRRLVRNHVSTTPVGFEHVRRTLSEAQLDIYATQLSRALKPHIRAEIISRWSQSEDTGLHLTDGKFIAVVIPGTDMRLSLMDGGFSYRGLDLTQTEATQLLMTRPEGLPPDATLLALMPELTEDHAAANFRIVGAAVRDDGSILPGLDREAVHRVAAAAHDALAGVSGSLAERESMARFFHWAGDDLRAAQSRQIIATIRTSMSPLENLNAGEIAREGLATSEDVRRFNDVRAGENRQRAAFHFGLAAQPRLAAAQYLASAELFDAAGDRVMAAGNYANAAEKLATCETFSPVMNALAKAFQLYENDFDAVTKVGARCAETFVKRGFHIGAAMVHELVFTRLNVLKRNVGADAAAAAIGDLIGKHQAQAVAEFAAVGLSAFDSNVPSLIRTAIDARLDRFDTAEGLQGDGYTILFEDKSDMISAEEFDKGASTEWLLLRRGLSSAPHQVFELMTRVTRDRLTSSGSRHPYLRQPLIESDFVDGVEALDMLTAVSAMPRVELRFSTDSLDV